MSSPNELRIFISSTFRDLQEEREHLVKKIFPEIRALCRERGVTFTDIDLRWGITEDEAEREGIIRICLDEIDRCRPYFIGILGERYGWTPPLSDAERVVGDFPTLAEVMLQGASITEMEIIHGVLANPAMADHAFFYFRDRAATPEEFIDSDPDTVSRLNTLKDRIRQSGFPVREDFSSPAELGAWLEEDLRRVVDAEHPASETPSALEVERRAHQAFAASRTRAYIPNPQYRNQFNAWIESSEKEQERANDSSDPILSPTPLVISGESGLGKSSLVSYLVDEYRTTHPTAFIIEHYIGASQTSGSATSVMRHIIEEIRERFGITDEVPAKPDDLEKSFPNWLFRAEHYARELGIEMLVVIDAVNQLDEAGRRLAWLPKILPEGIRVMISTTPREPQQRLVERGWNLLTVKRMEDEGFRQSIVVRYLGEFRKSINPEQIRRVTSDTKASSPLYLRVVSEELRLHGEHETLDAVIERYAGAADLLEVFDRVLTRFENDYGVATVERLMSVLWASRSGLSELELMDLAGLSRIELSRLLFAIDYHFLKRDGLLGFFHDYLRRAVEKRYLADDAKKRALHLRIAEYFQSGVSAATNSGTPVSVRMAAELAYQLHIAGSVDHLQECLSMMEIFVALYTGQTQYEVLTYWSAMAEGTDIEAIYRRGLERWEIEDAGEFSRGRGCVADLLQRLGLWAGAIAVERERLASAIARGDSSEQAASRQSLGWLLYLRGAYGEALEEASQAMELFTELGNRGGASRAIGTMGVAYTGRGDYDRAMECYEQQLSISEELGDRSGVATAIGNIGNVYSRRGKYDRALECYKRDLSICEELGDRRGASRTIANMGVVYQGRGEYDRAMECYVRMLNICEELGDRRGVAVAIGKMGNAYSSRGKYDQALECFERDLRICEEMGDRRGISVAIGNMGLVYSKRGEYDRALENFHRAAAEHRDIGFRYGLTYWLEGTARVFIELYLAHDAMPEYLLKYIPGVTAGTWRDMSLRYARTCAQECIAISDTMAKPDTQFSGRVTLVRISAAEGHLDIAREQLTTMLTEATDEVQQAEIHYWLWKLGASDHAAAALELYQTLYAVTPGYEYHNRIEELSTGHQQS